MTSPTPTVPVGAGTTLRRGASQAGPDNTVATLPAGDYPALGQCAGGEVVLPDGTRNFWWVKITAGADTGWVSAVTVALGDGDQPVPGVPELPTVND